ncbi:hypothetical protein GGI13_007636, partial [Coemansia sp. RSA 455]
MSTSADGMDKPVVVPVVVPFVEPVVERVDTSSSIKVPLTAINWRPAYLDRLEQLVLRVHYIKTHTYQLLRWIFVFEPTRNRHFDHGRFLEAMFFYYTFMGLANYTYPAAPAKMTTTMSDDGQPKVDEQGRPIVDITKQHVIDGLLTVLKAYVEARAVVWPLLSGFYSKTLTKHPESKHKIHKDERHMARSYPLHRKQRLSAYINQQQADYRLARNMRAAFGKDAIIMVGNWSASMAKYHEPIRGKSWRDLFKRFGFLVYLINEFRTSCVCA